MNEIHRPLRRAQVASMLGMSRTGVTKLHGTLLHPYQNADGVYEYSRAEVAEALKQRGGKRKGAQEKREHRAAMGRLSAKAFLMFEEQASLRDVVISLDVTPTQVLAWWKLWKYGFNGPPKPVRLPALPKSESKPRKGRAPVEALAVNRKKRDESLAPAPNANQADEKIAEFLRVVGAEK